MRYQIATSCSWDDCLNWKDVTRTEWKTSASNYKRILIESDGLTKVVFKEENNNESV